LFGLTKVALHNTSFLSAASFQETSRVLSRAAVAGRIDFLFGLKENLILGTRLPIGTNARFFTIDMAVYSNSTRKYLEGIKKKNIIERKNLLLWIDALYYLEVNRIDTKEELPLFYLLTVIR
jgi:DNA-directed RNA polymerase beta' subunit